MKSAGILKSQLAGLAGLAFRRVLVVSAVGNAEDLARGDAVWFEARIARFVILTVGLQLPFFTRNPGRHNTLNRAEVGAEQLVIVSGGDHRAAAIAHDGQRLRIQLFHKLVIAGHDRSDRGVEILYLGPLEILRLIPLPAPAACRRAVITKRAPNAIVSASTRQQGADLLDRGLRTAGTELRTWRTGASRSPSRSSSMVSLFRLGTSTPQTFNQSFIFLIWLTVLTAPSVILASSASISGPAASAILSAAWASARST